LRKGALTNYVKDGREEQGEFMLWLLQSHPLPAVPIHLSPSLNTSTDPPSSTVLNTILRRKLREINRFHRTTTEAANLTVLVIFCGDNTDSFQWVTRFIPAT